MSKQTEPTFLFVPGLRDHVAEHWQTLLANQLPRAVTVPPLTADKLSCAARVAAIEHALAQIDGDVVLVAHSAGVIMVVHWALQASRRIRGALLAAPPDLEHPLPAGYPALDDLVAGGWTPIPRRRLAFPSIVVASDNDPLARLDRVEGFARDWGSELVNAGAVGHLNPAAGFGDWPLAAELIRCF
jgi:hypothetical protein